MATDTTISISVHASTLQQLVQNEGEALRRWQARRDEANSAIHRHKTQLDNYTRMLESYGVKQI